MVKMLRVRTLPALWPALIGALLSLGLVLPVLRALSVDAMGAAARACLLAAAVCVLAGMGGKAKLAAMGLAAAIVLAYLFIGGGLARVGGMLGATIHLLRGNAEPLKVFADEAAVVAAALLTVAGWSMARQSAGFYPALSLSMVALLILWFSGGREALWLLAPALVALCALFARSVGDDTPYARILAGSALAVLLALCVSPTLRVTSLTLENFAERLRNYITDTFFFTEPRSVYSIQADGYKPLENRLGGPVNLVEQPVMTVETSKALLLRGVIMNHYNGLSWADTLSTRRYLYADPRHRGARADVLDEDRPTEALRENAMFDPIEIKVTMQTNSASTLFVPLRAGNLSTPMALVPYFNASSEIFITRNLMAGDTYAFDAAVVSASDPSLPELLRRAAESGERREMGDYLGVPAEVADDVRALTARVVLESRTPLEKALAIRNHLRANYAYTLTPDMPPGNQDFVSYFLLRGKEGYCTYFASAMAVMGRLAGLPTRYIEGYLVEPSGGIALVTSKKAHAWAEVYFDGFGWVAFDATPSDGSGGPRPDDHSPGGEQEAPADTGGDEKPPDEPEPSPSPEPREDDGDGATETPEGGEDDASGESSQGNGEVPEPSPSPEPEAPPEGESPPMPDPGADPNDDPALDQHEKRNSRWLLWLLFLLLLAAVALRALWTRPEAVAARIGRNDGERLLLWYRALLGVLAAAEMAARPYETPVQHFSRISNTLHESCNLISVADAVTHLGYGRFGASPAQVTEARAAYEAVLRHVGAMARARWLFTRLIKGIGSVERVP